MRKNRLRKRGILSLFLFLFYVIFNINFLLFFDTCVTGGSRNVIHNEEKTPHLHWDYMPFITGQKRGLGTKVANNRAIAQMGYEDSSIGETVK